MTGKLSRAKNGVSKKEENRDIIRILASIWRENI